MCVAPPIVVGMWSMLSRLLSITVYKLESKLSKVAKIFHIEILCIMYQRGEKFNREVGFCEEKKKALVPWKMGQGFPNARVDKLAGSVL